MGAEPIKRPGAYHVDAAALPSELVKQPAFWVLVVGLIAQALIGEYGTTWGGYHAAHLVLTLTDAFAGLRIAMWSPPRRAWTNEERIAHGLQPIEPDVARLIVLPPPLPPVQDRD